MKGANGNIWKSATTIHAANKAAIVFGVVANMVTRLLQVTSIMKQDDIHMALQCR